MNRRKPKFEVQLWRERTQGVVRETGSLAYRTFKISQALLPATQLLAGDQDITQDQLSEVLDRIFETLYAHPIVNQSRKLTHYLRESNLLPNEQTTENLIRYVVEQVLQRSPVAVPEILVNEFWNFFNELFSEPELKGLFELNLDITRLVLRTYEPLIVEAINIVKEVKRFNQSKVRELVKKLRVIREDLTIIKRQIKALRYIKPFFQTDPRDFHSQAQIVARMVREFGPFFIKMAQVVATNSNFLPEEICKELVVFQEDVPPMSALEVLRAFEESMGHRPWDRYFGFDECQPIKSGSIGSVYLAKRPVELNGREVLMPVIVKIRRDRLDREFIMGRTVLGLAIMSTQYWAPHSKLAPFLEALQQQTDEFAAGFERELDFEAEALIQQRFAERASDALYWNVPKVFYASRRILEMEYIEGAVSILTALRTFPVPDRVMFARQVASKFLFSVLNHIFLYQEFHGDLHPGNIMLNRQGDLYFIDWANCVNMAGKWKPLWDYVFGALSANVRLLADALINLSNNPEAQRHRRSEIESTLKETLRKKNIAPLTINSAAQLMREGVEGLHRRFQVVLHLMSNTQQLGLVIKGEYQHISRSLAALVGTYIQIYENIPKYFLFLDLVKTLSQFPLELVRLRIQGTRLAILWRFLRRLPLFAMQKPL